MEYKTIVVHVDESPQAAVRIDAAARLALEHNAHLIGSAPTNLPPRLLALSGLDPSLPPMQAPLTELRRLADSALDAFEQRASALGVLSVERRRLEEEIGLGMSLQARYCDLVVIGQHDAAHPLPGMRADFPEYLLLNSAKPVLVVPAAAQGPPSGLPLGQRIVVGWNGSAPASRAITSAIPLMQRARQVDIVVVDARAQGDVHGAMPGADLAAYLARHAIRVKVRDVDSHVDPGRALLAVAGETGADLIVMGAYGRSRFREVLLGGATRTLLRSSTLPLWMAH
ncbi:universal stress protein [Massilia scottii]|uniref:universal stress protein n=1 Tax=Massilia scottii TaxID=3057166 RepID=UPI002796B265|nr:universal stress protein [Massilia sp. CCM 9029]MDQ1831214.1 universal stress protein [Massilia sp. CCM 9029]